MSPMAYARAVRLRRVHRHLPSADPRQSSVAAIANRWGLMHLGRFAAGYKGRWSTTHRFKRCAPHAEPTADRFNVHPRQFIVQITRTGRRSRHFTDRLHLTSALRTFTAEGFQRIAAGLPPNDRRFGVG
jgi:hypothetical protein